MKLEKSPGYPEAVRAVEYIRDRWPARPRVGVVLGTGLRDVLHGLGDAQEIPFTSLPGFARPSVAGHGGALHVGFRGDVPVAVLAGRLHLYEGYGAAEVAFPVRVLALAGIRCLVATCAAGGISPRAAPGSLMLFRDHLNLQGTNPLAGPHDPRWGERFVDMSEAYDPGLRRHALKAARTLRLKCFEGVYASLLGPAYETPAEIRALRTMGAGAVGMSTAPEVVAARQMGVRVLALAVITNRAAGLSRDPLSHEDVLRTGQAASRNLTRLLNTVMPALGQTDRS